jgi:hypothetical protein
MNEPSTVEFDPEARELCPDGACTGLLGPEGRCKLCGTSASGEAPGLEPGLAGPDPVTIEDDDRRLCPDGACIGLLGPDGRCKACGRAASPA